MTAAHVAGWVQAHALSPSDVDCATTVMLKILDGKCKMNEYDKVVISRLYDIAKSRPGKLMGEEYHALIEQARTALDEALAMFIYEKRLLAETMISRPVMKAYKAWLRDNGILHRQDAEEA
jgi:hypothetical protein